MSLMSGVAAMKTLRWFLRAEGLVDDDWSWLTALDLY